MSRLLNALKHINRLPECWECIRLSKNSTDIISHYLQISNDYPFEVQLKNGISIKTNDFHDLVTCWVIFFREEYPIPSSAQTVVDIGANIGVFSLWVSKQLPQADIISVEPFPETYAHLVSNIHSHGLEERINTWSVGVSGKSGRGWMDASFDISQSRGMVSAPAMIDETAQKVEIETLSLDELLNRACENWSCSEIDLLKMDIEGSEHEVLGQASIEVLKQVKHLVLEYHPNQSKKTLFSKLEKAGFQCVVDKSFHPDCGVAHFTQLGVVIG